VPACLSRFHFDRLASAALGEPPGAFRRRLLLERAAHRLVSTEETVIRIGAEAAYTSPDAFTQAFLRAYGITDTDGSRPDCWGILAAYGWERDDGAGIDRFR
jgi:AraC family transcriptional regulator